MLYIENSLTFLNLEQIVPLGVDKRVNVNDALIFHYHHEGVQIQDLKPAKDDDIALILLCSVYESDIGPLKSLFAHIHHSKVPLLEPDFEIQGVQCLHGDLILE